MIGDTRTFSLPYPPSVNHYWRRVGQRTLISKKGREYRAAVRVAVRSLPKIEGRLSVRIYWFTPDKRKRDIDNILKATLDSMAHAGLYDDDSQIDGLHVVRDRCGKKPLFYF